MSDIAWRDKRESDFQNRMTAGVLKQNPNTKRLKRTLIK